MKTYFLRVQSSVGNLTLASNGSHLLGLGWNPPSSDWIENEEDSVLIQTRKELFEYFAGDRKNFTVPVQFSGTAFQILAWRALQKIPYGETWSYQQQAVALGNPKAVRAVGGANNRNPIAIIIPCHRVIGANGQLVGFGGGLSNKEVLLSLEKKNSRPIQPRLSEETQWAPVVE